MRQGNENEMSEKTVLVIFPTIYSINKISKLATNISKILKIRNLSFNNIWKNESVIIVEAEDPVLASSAINLLFGIDKIAIAKEVNSDFDSTLSSITNTALNLLLRGEKFFVKVDGTTKNFLAKDMEMAVTSSLVDKSTSLGTKAGSVSDYDRLVYTYVTNSFSYVCIFLDTGLGGIPYNVLKEKILCCIYDEISAIACLQTIKMGFEVKILVCYHDEPGFLKLAKMINRILPRIIQKNVTLLICKIAVSSNQFTTITTITQIMIELASKENVKRISLGISPLIYPLSFCEYNIDMVFQNNLVPWLPLAGIDSEILENSKEVGLEKYLPNLKNFITNRFNERKISRIEITKNAKKALENLKYVPIIVGPKNVHDIIDSIKSDH